MQRIKTYRVGAGRGMGGKTNEQRTKKQERIIKKWDECGRYNKSVTSWYGNIPGKPAKNRNHLCINLATLDGADGKCCRNAEGMSTVRPADRRTPILLRVMGRAVFPVSLPPSLLLLSVLRRFPPYFLNSWLCLRRPLAVSFSRCLFLFE